MTISPGITDILAAARFLDGRVRRTPVELSYPLSDIAGCDVFIKWENLQTCGSFKLRGALNKCTLSPKRKKARA